MFFILNAAMDNKLPSKPFIHVPEPASTYDNLCLLFPIDAQNRKKIWDSIQDHPVIKELKARGMNIFWMKPDSYHLTAKTYKVRKAEPKMNDQHLGKLKQLRRALASYNFECSDFTLVPFLFKEHVLPKEISWKEFYERLNNSDCCDHYKLVLVLDNIAGTINEGNKQKYTEESQVDLSDYRQKLMKKFEFLDQFATIEGGLEFKPHITVAEVVKGNRPIDENKSKVGLSVAGPSVENLNVSFEEPIITTQIGRSIKQLVPRSNSN